MPVPAVTLNLMHRCGSGQVQVRITVDGLENAWVTKATREVLVLFGTVVNR
jgi:hypothetical protein